MAFNRNTRVVFVRASLLIMFASSWLTPGVQEACEPVVASAAAEKTSVAVDAPCHDPGAHDSCCTDCPCHAMVLTQPIGTVRTRAVSRVTTPSVSSLVGRGASDLDHPPRA